MKCVIMQPTFVPWLGYFSLLQKADKFIFLDDVQLSKQSWQTRNRIKTKDGELWLSVPILHEKNHKEQLIKDTNIQDYFRWTIKTLKTLQQSYSKAKYFDEVYNFLRFRLASYCTCTLGEFNYSLIMDLAAQMNLEFSYTKCYVLSHCVKPTLDCVKPMIIEGEKDQRLVNICRAFACDEYLSPQGSSAYLEVEQPGGAFNGSGVTLTYQNYQHPIYPQLHGDFSSHMSILDLLFNVGFDQALNVINSGSRKDYTVTEFRNLRGLN